MVERVEAEAIEDELSYEEMEPDGDLMKQFPLGPVEVGKRKRAGDFGALQIRRGSRALWGYLMIRPSL